MTSRNLDKIFEPEKIAVIGATERKNSAGLKLIKNLIDRFEDNVYPVNPNRETVLEIDCYSGVEDISEPVDLGIITTPAHTVPEIVENCGRAGIPALIIISAGFGESGEEGRII